MAATDNTNFGPPPLTTPLGGPGDGLNLSWVAWLNRLYQRLVTLMDAVLGQVVIDNVNVTATTPGASSNVLTITGYTPTAADVGNTVTMTGGTHINPGSYKIIAQSPTTWTLKGEQDLTTAAGAGSAAKGKMGGLVLSHVGSIPQVTGPGTIAEGGLTYINGYINAAVGYRIAGTAGIGLTVIPLAKLTTGGVAGSITVKGGIVIGFSNPT